MSCLQSIQKRFLISFLLRQNIFDIIVFDEENLVVSRSTSCNGSQYKANNLTCQAKHQVVWLDGSEKANNSQCWRVCKPSSSLIMAIIIIRSQRVYFFICIISKGILTSDTTLRKKRRQKSYHSHRQALDWTITVHYYYDNGELN